MRRKVFTQFRFQPKKTLLHFCLKTAEILNEHCPRLSHRNNINKSNNNNVGVKLLILCHLNIKPNFKTF